MLTRTPVGTRFAPSDAPRYYVLVGTIGLCAALAITFVIWPAQQLVDSTFDPYGYSALARQIVADGYGAHGLTKREASLYPGLIAAVYALFGEVPVLIQLIQCAFFSMTAVVVLDIGRRVYNARTGLIAGLFVALNPLLLRYVPDLHTETMLTLAVVLSVWAMVRFHERQTVVNGVFVGLTVGIGALTKGVAIVPGIAFGTYWVVRAIRERWDRAAAPAPWTPIIAIALATAAVILPWTVRNYAVTGGRFVPLAPGINDAFLRGYVFSRLDYALLRRPPYVDAENECNAWLAELCRRRGVEVGRDELVDEQIFGEVAKQKIIEEPLELVRKTVVGLFTFWYQMTNLLNSAVAGVFALGAWALALVGLTGTRARGRPNWLLLMPILTMNVFVAFLCSLGRYSVPILPLLMILSAFGVDTLRRRARAGSTPN